MSMYGMVDGIVRELAPDNEETRTQMASGSVTIDNTVATVINFDFEPKLVILRAEATSSSDRSVAICTPAFSAILSSSITIFGKYLNKNKIRVPAGSFKPGNNGRTLDYYAYG